MKAEFEANVQQAVKQQLGSFTGTRIYVERYLQPHEELQRSTEVIACRNLNPTLIRYMNGNTTTVEIVR